MNQTKKNEELTNVDWSDEILMTWIEDDTPQLEISETLPTGNDWEDELLANLMSNEAKGEKTRLIQKLNTAENQINQVSETAEQLQKEIKVLADRLDKASTEKINLKKNLLDFTSKNKNLEKDLHELQDRVRGQENQIIFLENRVKEFKKLQVKFIETKDSNDSRLDEDEPEEITKLLGDINELTLPTDSGDKSLHYELEMEQTNDFEQTIENLKTQIEHLNKTIIYLEQENQQLKKRVDMGVTHDDEDTKKNPKDDDIPATEQDDEDAKKVNSLGETPLMVAIAYGHEEVASYLWISSNVAQMAKENSTVLHYAAKHFFNTNGRFVMIGRFQF
ncbi:hypothetical protein OUZ56_012366 [Daphnia magna]|uniref:Ankyrin repeat domain-containing protein n=1 Tax=Daphnia magna TaxID=35525 RepID=A0ABQ9Z2T0_9CRUS|nr:hypothetical protein OUZ56_012366 [Daphnia magna]